MVFSTPGRPRRTERCKDFAERSKEPAMKSMLALCVFASAALVNPVLAQQTPQTPPTKATTTGNLPVTFHEWELPTPNSRPHDPLATADGMIWYTGMNANVLG